jgi:hypothetical protein
MEKIELVGWGQSLCTECDTLILSIANFFIECNMEI